MDKILFFASDYKIGISSLLTDQVIALKEAGAKIIAVSSNNEQEHGLYNKIVKNNININIVKELDEHRNFISLARKIKSIIKKNNVKIVHVQNNWQLAIVSFVKYVLLCYNIKIIYTIHAFRNNYKLKSFIAQLCIGIALLLFVDKVICMCSYMKKKFSLISYKILLLPLGVSDEYFTHNYIVPPINGLHLVFPAKFRTGKNQDMIIKAFAKFLHETKDNNSTLILPGSGELLDKMKALTKDLGVDEFVYFPGQCAKNELRDFYLKSNIGIVSSNSETFGQSIVEPYVLGRCVITRPVGIAKDIIKEENGYIFDNEDDLYKIFLELNKSLNNLIEKGQNNYKNRLFFSWQNISRKYIDLLLK